MSSIQLPQEILLMICQVLVQEEDFSTLFACALSNATLAEAALRLLYHLAAFKPPAPAGLGGEFRYYEGKNPDAAVDSEEFRHWASFWNIVIALRLRYAYRPAGKYIRALKLDGLLRRVLDQWFGGPVQRIYFADSVGREIVDVTSYNAIARSIVHKTPFLEALALVRWYGSSSAPPDGSTADKDIASIVSSTLGLKKLMLQYDCMTGVGPYHMDPSHLGPDDIGPDNFTPNDIVPNDIGRHTLLALGLHAATLRSLEMGELDAEALKSLGCLKGCTGLRLLALTAEQNYFYLEKRDQQSFLEIVSWLNACRGLKDLRLEHFNDVPAIVLKTLPTQSFLLERLVVIATPNYNDDFVRPICQGLLKQPELQDIKLDLEVGLEGNTTSEMLQVLVDSLGALGNLKSLDLLYLSESVTDEQVELLTERLPNLADLRLESIELTDNALVAMSQLQHLKHLTLRSATSFTIPAIKTFITSLDPKSNKGLCLIVQTLDPSVYDMEDNEVVELQKFLSARLGGRFRLD